MLHQKLLTILCRARETLSQMDDCPQSVRQVADEAGLSLYHFIRLYKAVFGETPNQYQIRMKLDKAKYLLAAGDYSVTDVCMAVGYSSVSTFSDLFSRRVGMTPSDYKRQFGARFPAAEKDPTQLIPGCFSLMFGSPE